MWPLCTANNFLWLLLPFLIGLVTGWWAWARKGNRSSSTDANYHSREQGSPEAAFADAGNRRSNIETVSARPSGIASPPGVAPSVGAAEARPAPSAAAAGLTAIGIPAASGDPDDLRRIKGVGPKLDELLQSLGVRRFDQIAAWGPGEIGKVDSHLGAFSGRIERDNWVEQAKLLARGAFEEFESRFGESGKPQM
jgi:predicted flap endonuclease-1-like 5' DNA nuclease